MQIASRKHFRSETTFAITFLNNKYDQSDVEKINQVSPENTNMNKNGCDSSSAASAKYYTKKFSSPSPSKHQFTTQAWQRKFSLSRVFFCHAKCAFENKKSFSFHSDFSLPYNFQYAFITIELQQIPHSRHFFSRSLFPPLPETNQDLER